jgi:hypothetical protein
MKNPFTTSALPQLTALMLVACDSSTPEIVFESAFPTPHQELRVAPGRECQLRPGRDTLRYRLTTSREAALFTPADKRGPVFFGKLARFRGVYYFNQPQKDASCYVYALKIRDNFVSGLHQRQEPETLKIIKRYTDLKEVLG